MTCNIDVETKSALHLLDLETYGPHETENGNFLGKRAVTISLSRRPIRDKWPFCSCVSSEWWDYLGMHVSLFGLHMGNFCSKVHAASKNCQIPTVVFTELEKAVREANYQ